MSTMTAAPPESPQGLDLRSIVISVLNVSSGLTGQEMADAVLEKLPEESYRDALRILLPKYIASVNNRSAEAKDVRDVADSSKSKGAAPGSHASRKVAGIAAAWSRVLTRQIPLPNGTYRRLADASVDEVDVYAQMLGVKARQTAASAQAFTELANVMREQRVRVVRDLPVHLGVHLFVSEVDE